MPPKYMTKKQIADALGVSHGTVRRWVIEGVIPPDAYFRRGNVVRYSLEKVEAALHEKEGGIQQEFDFGDEDDDE